MAGDCSGGRGMLFDNKELRLWVSQWYLTHQYRIKSKLSVLKLHLIILLSYSIISIIFTYPVAFSKDKIPGGWDAFQFLWFFWWFKESLLNYSNPYYTDYIFFPNGVSLASSTITPLNSISSIPLQLTFDLITAYKIIWILTFIFSGYGAFLLVKYLTGDMRAAFMAGLIFMFCPYRFAHALGHMNLISTQWIPLYVLFLIKTINEKRVSNALLAGLFLFLTTISCYFYFVYLSIFSLLYLIYRQWSNKDILNSRAISRISIIAISYIITAVPFIYPVFRELFSPKSSYMYPGGFVEYSADLLGYFVPHDFHPIFKSLVYPITSNFTGHGVEYTVFVGYTVIVLSILCLIKIKPKDVKFWLLSALFFAILSLGPILQINGIVSFSVDGHILYIPLPYAVLMDIPLFSMLRAPSRWAIMVMLSLCVLAGYGMSYILQKAVNNQQKNNYKSHVLFILVCCIILFEFLSAPYGMSSAEIPAFYRHIASDDEDYTILDVPLINNAEAMYYQTHHGKKMIGGYVSRTPDDAINFLKSTPLFSNILNFYPPDEDIIIQNQNDIDTSIANYLNIKYIILHKGYLNAEQMDIASDLIQKTIKKEPQVYEDNYIIVYEVKDKTITSFMILKRGWHQLENWDDIPTRWMSDDASLLIYSNENCSADLSFQALSFYHPRTFEIYINDEPSGYGQDVPTECFVMVNVPINLNKGANMLRIYVPDGFDRPSKIPGLKSDDNRCISLAIQNVTIEYREEYRNIQTEILNRTE